MYDKIQKFGVGVGVTYVKRMTKPDIEDSFMNPCSLTYNDSQILEKFPFSEIRNIY